MFVSRKPHNLSEVTNTDYRIPADQSPVTGNPELIACNINNL